jgi:antitoxin component of MazEF toxin-antitoxin module
VDAGKIILKPEKKSAVDLNKLLSKVNSSNIHGETDTGKSVGRESSL